MDVSLGQDPRPHITLFNTAQTTNHSPMPDMDAGGKDVGETLGLLPGRGEDSRLCLSEWALDLGGMTRQMRQKLRDCCQDVEKTADFVQASGL